MMEIQSFYEQLVTSSITRAEKKNSEMVALSQTWKFATQQPPSAQITRQTPLHCEPSLATPIRMVLRARFYDPHTAEFTSPDPLEYVDGMSLFRGYFLIDKTDAKGTIKIQPLRASGSLCGERAATWDLFLENAAVCEGYMIQKVTRSCLNKKCPCDCKDKFTREDVEYWEYWEVKKGEITPHERINDQSGVSFTDMFSFHGASGCGSESVKGEIRFYCKNPKDSPDNVGSGPEPSGTVTGKLCGKTYTSGTLKGTKMEPDVWDEKPIESSGSHSGNRVYFCCPSRKEDDGFFEPGVAGGNNWDW